MGEDAFQVAALVRHKFEEPLTTAILLTVTEPGQAGMGQANRFTGVPAKISRTGKHDDPGGMFRGPVAEEPGILSQHQVHEPIDLRRSGSAFLGQDLVVAVGKLVKRGQVGSRPVAAASGDGACHGRANDEPDNSLETGADRHGPSIKRTPARGNHDP